MFKHALKIEVSFDEETSRILDSQSRIVNWLHNHLLETANRLRADYRESQDKATGLTLYSKRGLRNMLPELKKEMPFLKAVHSSPLKNKALELSASIQAYQNTLNELYRLRRDRTKTYLYSIANSLFRDYDLVSIGDYTPRGGGISRKMRRSMNNLSVIGRFKEVLHWVSLRSGKHYSVWNEYNTTKTCSSCKKPLDQSLSPKIRRWRCPSCGQDHIRDENAAINGLQKTFEMRGSRLPEYVEIRSRRAWRYSGLGVREIPGAAVGNCL